MRKVIRRVTIRCWSGLRQCRMRLEVKVARRCRRRSLSGGRQKIRWLLSFDGGDDDNNVNDGRRALRASSRGSGRRQSTSGDSASSASDVSDSSGSEEGCVSVQHTASYSDMESDSRNQNQNQNQTQADVQSPDSLAANEVSELMASSGCASEIASFFGSHTADTMRNAANVADAGAIPGSVEDESAASCCLSMHSCRDAAEPADDSGVASSDSADMEAQAQLRRLYEAELDLAVRMHRTIVDPELQPVDMARVRQNLGLVKQRRHPIQLMMEGRRQEEMGLNRIQQLLTRRRIQLCKRALDSGAAPPEAPPAYPDWLAFRLRVKVARGDRRWREFVKRLAQERSAQPDDGERAPSVKESQKYSPEYIDVWTNNVTVMVKNKVTVGDVMEAAFVKLGLEHRADFKFTIGCFAGDKRRDQDASGGGAPRTPVEVFDATPVLDLYRQNAGDIFLNSNKQQMYQLFPDFFDKTGPARPAAAAAPTATTKSAAAAGKKKSVKKRKR